MPPMPAASPPCIAAPEALGAAEAPRTVEAKAATMTAANFMFAVVWFVWKVFESVCCIVIEWIDDEKKS